jgi:hypothetical protein
MSFDPRQELAISSYLKAHPELRLTLQADHGSITFIEKATNKRQVVGMKAILDAYDADKKEAARERARQKRESPR